MRKTLLMATMVMVPSLVVADEHEPRHHDAHEHGAAVLSIAQQGKEFELLLHSPAFNIVGFEHHPNSDHERALVNDAMQTLNQGEALFSFPSSAKCELERVDVDSRLSIEGDHDEDHDHEADHDEEHEHESDHDEEHEHESDHDGGHSDVDVQWHFSCAHSEKVSSITVTLFERFQHLNTLNVEYLLTNKQGATALSEHKNIVNF